MSRSPLRTPTALQVVGRVRRAAASGAVLAIAACGTLKDLQDVSEALESRYGEVVGVNIMNGTQVTLTFSGDRYSALATADRERIAREAAHVAYAALPHPGAVETVTVMFPQARGAIVFTWPAAEVRK